MATVRWRAPTAARIRSTHAAEECGVCTPLPHAMLVRLWREPHLDAARASEGLSLATAGLSKTLHVCRNAWQPLPKASRHQRV